MILNLILYLFFTVAGLILIKLGSADVSLIIRNAKINFSFNFYLILGLLCYMASFILWTLLLKNNKLSYVVPLTTGISQVLILFSSFYILKETIKPLNLIGAAIVIIGVIIMNLK